MAPPIAFASRGSDGVDLRAAPDGKLVKHVDDAHSKCCAYSPDGKYFAYSTSAKVVVIDGATGDVVHTWQRQGVLRLVWACASTHFTTYEQYFTRVKGQAGEDNVRVWDVRTGQQVMSYICKRTTGWWPQWSSDGKICGRLVSSGVQFYDGAHLEEGVVGKCPVDNAADFAFSKASQTQPCKVAVFAKAVKGGSNMVKVFDYGRFERPTANKSFFKADNVKLLWNQQGTAVLVKTETEKDATGKSYYGETGLHYVAANGSMSCTVQLDKNGPIYACDFCPTSTDFTVVYGYMPARTVVFDDKCNVKIDLGSGPRNELAYAPQGHLLCLYGTGNLRGTVEIWETLSGREVGKFKAEDSTSLQWFPDGHHLLTATCAPRLRQGNGFKVWRIDGQLVHLTDVPNPRELWEAVTRSHILGTFPIAALPALAKEKAIKAQPVKVAAYRPPGSSGKASFKLHDDEPASSTRPKGAVCTANQNVDKDKLSKSALKRMKAKEKAAKERDAAGSAAPAEAASTVGGFVPVHGTQQVGLPAGAEPEVDAIKKIRKIKKTLRAIEQLKASQVDGNALEANQLAKLQTEAALLQELEQLELKA